MSRDLATIESTEAEPGRILRHVRSYRPGDIDLPEGGRVLEFHFPETDTEPAEKVCFIERIGKSTLRRTSQMWFDE